MIFCQRLLGLPSRLFCDPTRAILRSRFDFALSARVSVMVECCKCCPASLGRTLLVMGTQRDGQSDANDWTARMQVGGQICAIIHTAFEEAGARNRFISVMQCYLAVGLSRCIVASPPGSRSSYHEAGRRSSHAPRSGERGVALFVRRVRW